MNRHNAHLFMPLVAALADGKTIQYRSSPNKDWGDMLNPDIAFSSSIDKYRIKPEPVELHAVYNARGDRLYVGEKKGFDAWMQRNDPRRECKYTFKKFVEAA